MTHLRERGVEHVVVCGHSSGGYYAVDLIPRDHGVAGWVLLSPLTNNKNPFAWWWPDPADVRRARQRAAAMVANGRGRDLIPVSGWFHAISAGSLLQRFEEPDDLWLTNVQQATAPVLMVWGDAEPRHGLWQQHFTRFAGPRDRYRVLAGAGHYYQGHERALADEIDRFLADLALAGPGRAD